MRIAASHHAVLAAALLSSGVPGAVCADDAKGIEFFEKNVRPVLVNRCYECHSAGKKIKGGLLLDTKAGVLAGGDSGPALAAGDPDKSKLIEAVRYKNQDMQMPPKSPLPASELKALEDWVRMGAPDPRVEVAVAKSGGPRVIDVNEGRKFWAFAPVTDPPLPKVNKTTWVRSPIDAFILAALEKNGLSPAPPADARTLIRRATFDLTGLPPTPEEVESFVLECAKDEDNETMRRGDVERNAEAHLSLSHRLRVSSSSYDRLIERLLASPAYGERWGRHWLDVARYADSNGLDENLALGHAWRYRDYVVNAFNNDKPFDQFLIEQIAGDLLAQSEMSDRKSEMITATGFLSLGAKVLAEPDMEKLVMDIIDEQIDTTGKAFLGMTLGCARCHDHKFDPVKTDDYYALAAIFKSTKSLGDKRTGAIKHWYEHSLATPEQIAAQAAHAKTVAAKSAEVKGFATKARADLKKELQDHAADYLAAAASLTMQADFSEVKSLAASHKLRPRYLLTCRQYLEKNQEHPVFTKWHELVRANRGSEVRAHYAALFAAAAAASQTTKPEPIPQVAAKGALAKRNTAAKAAAATVARSRPADPHLAAAYDALNDIAGFLAIPDKDADAFDEAMLAKVKEMNDAVMALDDKTPDPPAVMSVSEGAVLKTLPVHIRGSHLTLGKPVARGYPEVMNASLAKPILPAKQSGRLELARWMASAEHPLTARVFVNRAWRWHFGKGIVTSTDNFGLLGDKPSHPELLDYLARRFVESGWSVKELHRMIMKSSVYQQSSETVRRGDYETMRSSNAGQAAASEVSASHSLTVSSSSLDPENRLLSRFSIRRLEAEEIRDALLSVSGWLSTDIGGKTIPLRNKEFVFNHTSTDRTKYESPRRALYLPIIRNHLYDMLEQFDYPDPTMPTGSRNSTVIAPQALIMLNSPVAMDAAARLASRLEHDAANTRARITQAYMLAYGRPPTENEITRAESFIAYADDARAGLILFCQSLMAANEFMYLR